jgi:hypothetical protein
MVVNNVLLMPRISKNEINYSDDFSIVHTPFGCKYVRTGNRPRLRNFELPISIAFVDNVGT